LPFVTSELLIFVPFPKVWLAFAFIFLPAQLTSSTFVLLEQQPSFQPFI